MKNGTKKFSNELLIFYTPPVGIPYAYVTFRLDGNPQIYLGVK